MELHDEPPRSAGLTAYDRAHLVTYLRLLDAADAAAPWREVVRLVFRLNPDTDPERHEHMHRTHLARAEWVRDRGYAELTRNQPLAS